MIDKIKQVLTKQMSIVLVDVRKSLKDKGREATGKTTRALRVVVTETPTGLNGSLLGPAYIQALEDGRGPTRAGAPRGNPPLVQAIAEWMKAKGIVGSPWAIAKKIHEKGYKGKPGAISDGLKGKEESIKREITLAASVEVNSAVKGIMNK